MRFVAAALCVSSVNQDVSNAPDPTCSFALMLIYALCLSVHRYGEQVLVLLRSLASQKGVVLSSL